MMEKENPGNEAVKFPGLFWQGGRRRDVKGIGKRGKPDHEISLPFRWRRNGERE